MTIDAALAICADRFLTRGEVVKLCAATAADSRAALDAVAREVASRYLQGVTGFMDADTLMNDLYMYAVTDGEASPFFTRVYEAFDQGECLHPGDQPGSDPEAAYTKPMLSALVAEGPLPNTSLERTREG
jgi:hypothetical protein